MYRIRKDAQGGFSERDARESDVCEADVWEGAF